MRPLGDAIALIAMPVLFGAGLIAQRCSYERRLAETMAVTTKADAQLVQATTELATEHVEAARTKAVAKRAAVARAVHDAVARDTGDADLADWIAERTGGD